LGVDHATHEGAIIVGADHLGCLLDRLLTSLGRQVVLIDRHPGLCRSAQNSGLSVYQGDALSIDALEEAGARYADTVIALTRNAELNALVVRRVRDNFRTERLFALGAEPDSAAVQPPFPGNFPGVDEVNLLLRRGQLRIAAYAVPAGEAVGRRLAELPYSDGEFAMLVQRGAGALIATGDQQLAEGDRLWCAKLAGGASPLATVLEVVGAAPTLDVPLRGRGG